jgi:uncharacterized protein
MINDINSQMIAQMWPSLEQSLRGQLPNLSPSDWAQMRSEFEQIVAAAATSQWTQMPALYARHLTADEMRDILAFYRTPTGAKTLTIMPQIARELASMTDMAGMMERISAAFSRILKQRGYGAK